MRIRDSMGSEHDLSNGNTVVTTFRKEVWRYMNHIFHMCIHPCEAGYENPLVIFHLDLVKQCLGQRFDELRRWEPNEDEFAAWDRYTQQNPLGKSDLRKIKDELKDGVNWKELEDGSS